MRYFLPRFVFRFFIYLTLTVCTSAHGGDTTAPPLQLAKVYDEKIDLNDYWISEKLDGVRAYWDGSRLLSRSGNIFRAPGWFIADFPAVSLDGELWMGRGTFALLSGAVRRREPDDAEWRKIRYRVFDLPDSTATFDERLVKLRHHIAGSPSPYLSLVEQSRVTSHEALMERLDELVAQGAEGLMLHKGSSRYRSARSDDLLKLKPYRDAEAVVLAHLPGRGKYEGMLGSLLVETPQGLRFKVGTGFSDAERRDPPEPGATITYKYYGKTKNGIPRFASFLRERKPE